MESHRLQCSKILSGAHSHQQWQVGTGFEAALPSLAQKHSRRIAKTQPKKKKKTRFEFAREFFFSLDYTVHCVQGK